jgi:hypothetical protein
MPATPTVPAAPSARLRRGNAPAYALLALATLAGAFLVLRPDDPTPRPDPGDVLLAETTAVAPTSRRLRVKMPCRLRFSVDAPASSPVEVAFGPPQPVERAPADVPDPDRATTWTAEPGRPHDRVVLAPGLYVLRIVPKSSPGSPPAAGSMTVRVEALPP